MSRKFKGAQYTDPKGSLIDGANNTTSFAEGTVVPTDATAGYTKGCLFLKTNGSAGTQLYINEGTDASCDFNAMTATATIALLVKGVAAGYRVARGVHTQVAASDTIVTGLTTVVAAVAGFDSAPTVKQLFVSATIGDQAGTPAAGSILTRTYKPTAVNDVTPTAATDFTDNLGIAWIAVGT